MKTEEININITITWNRLKNSNGDPYIWGNKKSPSTDARWLTSNLIYRWVKKSTEEIATIGETKRRLTDRINNYISASPNSRAGAKNKKVFNEQTKLQEKNDYLYLEFTDCVLGYDLNNNRERKIAENLLIGFYKPYLI